MASVTSLGLHQPAGLQYLIQEGLLPAEPCVDSYTWNVTDSDEDGAVGDDEIISTKTCVVWCNGGIVRKSFRFEVEGEPVTRAILTHFSSEQYDSRTNTQTSTPNFVSTAAHHVNNRLKSQTKPRSSSRHKALVVFLRTQLHLYFLSGSSHVIHLPFEVEYATAAPRGLLIQRKPNAEKLAANSSKIPRVPPNSFVPSQPHVWSAASSVQSTFSAVALGSPRQLVLPQISLLGNGWQTPEIKDDSTWPRLFSLTDPLTEMGLVVTDSRANGNKRASIKSSSLGPNEELLHITNSKEFTSIQTSGKDPLVIAITVNRDANCYTIWKVQYLDEDVPVRPAKRSATVRRRSSFAPGPGTGTTTPIAKSQYGFRESIGGLTAKHNTQADGKLGGEMLDFANALDLDFEEKGMPRRSSRRVSSYLARADLSATHERSAFSELATAHQNKTKRGESMGSQHTRTSYGGTSIVNVPTHHQHSGQSLNSFLEAPVDDLLDELRAGGDFEGFHNMGLDDEDFEGLRKEVVFNKIESVPLHQTTVRFSMQHKPAHDQLAVFTMIAPRCASEDPRKNEIVVCILDKTEKQLVVVSLNTKLKPSTSQQPMRGHTQKPCKDTTVITQGTVRRAKRVLDACKVEDGQISRMLILTESSDGHGDLTLQAPWSQLMKVEMPSSLHINNLRSLGHDPFPQKKREGGFKRVLSDRDRSLRSLRNAAARGRVDIVDDQGHIHQVQLHMEPRQLLVKQIINVCRSVLPGSRGGEGILVAWWSALQWITETNKDFDTNEWTALVVVLFSAVLAMSDQLDDVDESSGKPNIRARSRSRGLSKVSNGKWTTMMIAETANFCAQPSWSAESAWGWLANQQDTPVSSPPLHHHTRFSIPTISDELQGSVRSLVKLARKFLASPEGQSALNNGLLPSAKSRTLEARLNSIADILTGLHLLREEQKLNIATSDMLTTGAMDLAPILAQLYRWVGWDTWIAFYDLGDATMDALEFENAKIVDLPEPANLPDVYQWIESSLVAKRLGSFATIADITFSRSASGYQGAPHIAQSSFLTPRTMLFRQFFSHILPDSSAVEMISALQDAGLTTKVLETLPEAILVPLKESVATCQLQPSASWSRDILTLIDREDVNLLLVPEARRNRVYSSILAPTHQASIDVHSVCSSTSDVETLGSFDGSAEVDRQAITGLLFKEDRRFNEAASILNTAKQVIARVDSQPGWTDSDLLDAQKNHVLMLATRTLAIATGRGLLYFSARIPLLTEKFPIGGFNLQCTLKPLDNVVSADKVHFTEEKVSWAFFHSGVSAGLSISRGARGIDTSWILYNKPVDLSNRHAGFLLALGLNGHLKAVAKWVAFKYLTPKHTMTSIGLLLGLAASYLGTMDSLITRLLSVHVTRMLPPGAAELNLSPLTQTSGIMGIGLLYCNTQHRRMSEIMISEVEHAQAELEDEPLHNEGYRLASGFALGLINLGKGSDLRGLHDMDVTERLLRVAVGSKKIDLVHILDKSTAAAIVAFALIFMKTENASLARKIDIPESTLQYDYVRPDMFLLRTLARHLIMWNEIKATPSWVESMLPRSYRHRSGLTAILGLDSEDLPFYNIITGLLFSIALRFAGSGSAEVRDLLIYYLDQMSRICGLPGKMFDQTLTRTTVRNCLDLVALSTAAVMAGTGDLTTFRRLRALHGRDDAETPYGSHLAAHMAIGALFLGGGTHTFGTSNLATASLIASFYPLFPATILDNSSHLQAFRHFWVLATEPRCLVTRDIDTNRPVSIPLSITMKSGVRTALHAPCLLPNLDLINSVATSSSEYWNVVLDLGTDQRVQNMFNADQTVWVRRKQAMDAKLSVFQATLQTLDSSLSVSSSSKSTQPLEWLFGLAALRNLTEAEQALVLGPVDGAASTALGSSTTAVDARLILEKASLMSGKRDRLQGLKLLFAWKAACEARGEDMSWIRGSVIDGLRASVWLLGDEQA